jgi:hypothetical protein
MKLTLTLLALTSSVGLVSAYTVTVTNQSTFGDPALPLTDNTNTPLASGTVAVGYFGSDADVIDNSLDFAALLSGFTEYGTSTSIAGKGATTGLLDLVTPANWTVAVPSNSTDGQIGQNVYVVFGNGDTLSSSDLLAVWKSGSVFGKEDDAGNGGVAADLAFGKGDLLLGTINGPTDITAGANTITYANRIGLVGAIPEPSTSLLAGLAGLALAIRRRR